MKALQLLTILLCVAMTAGCIKKPMVKTEYVEKKVPVNAVPAPPTVPKPVLETSKLTEEDKKNLGKVTQAYVVENKQLKAYTGILEMIINTYRELSEKAEVTLKPLVLGEIVGTENSNN
jgi:hypothetical protein